MKLQDMMFIALFAAIIGAFAFFPPIPIPFLPIPITMQTFAVMLAGSLLGAKRGSLSLIILIMLLAIGAPLLAGGRGGLGVIFGPTGGYIIGWPFAAFVIGFLTERNIAKLTMWRSMLYNSIGGILIIYLFGITYLSLTSNLPWGATAISNLAFLPGDIIKVVLVSILTIKLHKIYPFFKYLNCNIKRDTKKDMS